MAVIELAHVVKSFAVTRQAGRLRRQRHEVLAVDDLSLAIEGGSIVGYIGPNGAGKSTTVKLCTGILVPTSGEVKVCGLDPTRARVEVTRHIGVVFGQRTQLWWDLLRTEGTRQWLRFNRDNHTAAEILAGVAAQAPVRDIAIEDPSIEEIVRCIYQAARPDPDA